MRLSLLETEHMKCTFVYTVMIRLSRTRLFPVDISVLTSFPNCLNRPLVRRWKSVPTLFVWTSEISGLSEPGLTNHHCIDIMACVTRHKPIFNQGTQKEVSLALRKQSYPTHQTTVSANKCTAPFKCFISLWLNQSMNLLTWTLKLR